MLEILSAIWQDDEKSFPVLHSTFPITLLHTLEILAVTQGDSVLTVIPVSGSYWAFLISQLNGGLSDILRPNVFISILDMPRLPISRGETAQLVDI